MASELGLDNPIKQHKTHSKENKLRDRTDIA